MKNAKAAVFTGVNKPFDLREFLLTPAPKGYAKMELIASGVCGTDLHFHNGKLPIEPPTIIGHEFIGRILEADAEEAARFGLKEGDAVIADIAVPCGECLLCKNGDDANCVRMQVTNGGSIHTAPYLYGGYAEINYTPLTNLIPIPASVDPAMAAGFACPGPTAIHAFALAEKAGITVGKDTVAVVQGLGPVGFFALLYLKAMGAKVYAIIAKEDPARAALAKKLGAEEVLLAEEATAYLQKLNDGLGVDLCFEASGAPAAIPQGMDILRNRGVYLVPGQYSNSGSVAIAPQLITFKALQILGSSQYSVCDVKAYLQFLEAHPELHDSIAALATRYPLAEINQAFADAKAGKNIKTVLVK